MPNTYSIIDGMCREDARMKAPIFPILKGPMLIGRDQRIQYYHYQVKKYNRHIASLRSCPIEPGSVWKKTEGLIPNVDFVFHHVCGNIFVSKTDRTELSEWNRINCPTCKIVAVPLPAEQTQEQLWEDVYYQAEGLSVLGFVRAMKEKYTITHK